MPAQSIKRPLVIGYGNPLREDDGIGQRAAHLIQAQLVEAHLVQSSVVSDGVVAADAVGISDAEVMHCHQLTPELAVKAANASIVVFLDAVVFHDAIYLDSVRLNTLEVPDQNIDAGALNRERSAHDGKKDPELVGVRCVAIAAERSNAWSHHLSPAQLVDLAGRLYGSTPPAFLVTGGIRRTEWRACLTPSGEQTAAEMASAALKLIG